MERTGPKKLRIVMKYDSRGDPQEETPDDSLLRARLRQMVSVLQRMEDRLDDIVIFYASSSTRGRTGRA